MKKSSLATSVVFLTALLVCPVSLYAQKPARLEPLPEPPDFDAQSEPAKPESDHDAVFFRRENQTETQYQVNGQVRLIKVTPQVGPVYYLADPDAANPWLARGGQSDDKLTSGWIFLAF